MKIENSAISLNSQHASTRRHTVEESLRVWAGARRPDFERNDEIRSLANQTVATLSDAGRQAAANSIDHTNSTPATNETSEQSIDPKMQVMIRLIEAMTGQKIRIFDPSTMKLDGVAGNTETHHSAAQNRPQGGGVEYDRRETLHETEVTRFQAEGVIKTSDGREISFSLSLEMRREFYQESNVSIRQGDPARKDPLVINFAGTAAQLTDTKFAFDLDSDGKNEQTSFVGAGSGFLALDKNDNGIIDNGSELFGTQSGNGFADLSAYDHDGNQWIDENDDVYSKLQVWSKDADGKDQLSSLAQRKVGALYLGNVATPFDLKNGANDLQGQVRSSGIYLKEDGGAGTLQQVDLIV
ncbi:MAG: hypothetical protein Q7U37_00030 [Gallionella sp.]|nr:hypothetical protein [Gallionella sp.]